MLRSLTVQYNFIEALCYDDADADADDSDDNHAESDLSAIVHGVDTLIIQVDVIHHKFKSMSWSDALDSIRLLIAAQAREMAKLVNALDRKRQSMMLHRSEEDNDDDDDDDCSTRLRRIEVVVVCPSADEWRAFQSIFWSAYDETSQSETVMMSQSELSLSRQRSQRRGRGRRLTVELQRLI